MDKYDLVFLPNTAQREDCINNAVVYCGDVAVAKFRWLLGDGDDTLGEEAASSSNSCSGESFSGRAALRCVYSQ